MFKTVTDFIAAESILNHQQEVEAYRRQRQQQAPLFGELNQTKFDPLFKGDRVLLHVSHS